MQNASFDEKLNDMLNNRSLERKSKLNLRTKHKPIQGEYSRANKWN